MERITFLSGILVAATLIVLIAILLLAVSGFFSNSSYVKTSLPKAYFFESKGTVAPASTVKP